MQLQSVPMHRHLGLRLLHWGMERRLRLQVAWRWGAILWLTARPSCPLPPMCRQAQPPDKQPPFKILWWAVWVPYRSGAPLAPAKSPMWPQAVPIPML